MEARAAARTAVVGATGAVVVAGAAFGLDMAPHEPADQPGTASALDAAFEERGQHTARGGLGRAPVTATVAVGQTQQASPGPTTTSGGADLPVDAPADCEVYSGNRQLGCALLGEFGFGLDQMEALDALWTHESGWNHQAENPSTGAYGIPQALPGSKMASVGEDWRTNPETQIRWGLSYIKDRYGSPNAAYEFFSANGWY